MNDTKTEVLSLVLSSKLSQVSLPGICIGGHKIVVSESVRNIGVIFDFHVSIIPHIIKSVCKKAFWNLQNLAKLRPFLSHSALERLVHAFVTSNLD